jgi:spore germination protein YaaH/putative cell wall-binding protein
MKVKLITKRLVCMLCIACLLGIGLFMPQPLPVQAESTIERLAGNTLYDTALAISNHGWDKATSVALANGENFPDALAGTVLAQKIGGPLLLTPPKSLYPSILPELKRLGTETVYLLGGTAAIDPSIQEILQDNGYRIKRLAGYDQYGTAAAIASEVSAQSSTAYLVYGQNFPDALSISSYAASKGIPLLMTKSSHVPPETIQTLKELGVSQVTLIGGTAVISDAVVEQLQSLPQPVQVQERIAGFDKYDTNTAVLRQLMFDPSLVYVATGENFPDALTGAALAAQSNHPIVLVPKTVPLNATTLSYLNERRTAGASFIIFGGWGAIPAKVEDVIRTGKVLARISLQYTQGSALEGNMGMLRQVQMIPSPATDYVDLIAPSWYYLNDEADGTISSTWDSHAADFKTFVDYVHARNLKVLPMLSATWATPATVDTVLTSAAKREILINQICERIQTINADGIVIDFELFSSSTGPSLTRFMQELYPRLHAQNKLVVIAVMAKTPSTPWLDRFNYYDLSQTVDYLHIMTYDYHTGTPGPIAPLQWMNQVIQYTKSQGVDLHKVLLGIPYYGADWWAINPSDPLDPNNYSKANRQSRGLYALEGNNPHSTSDDINGAMDLLTEHNAVLHREQTVPYFTYTVDDKYHRVYFEDAESWDAKLSLLAQYPLGGIGAWSLHWTTNPDTINQLFPLLKQHLR